MPQPNQENCTARRFQLFDTENTPPRYDAGYECELPPNVRAELVSPKRARILGRSKTATLDPAVKGRLYLTIFVALMVIGGAIATWRQGETAERARTKAISQPLAPQPAPRPTPIPPTQVVPTPMPAIKAPRATLVKLPPPRPQLVSLPEWKVGVTRPVMMPYNIEVLATYRCEMPSLDALPSHRNHIGDMWLVGQVPWVWIWAPGAARADWIDP